MILPMDKTCRTHGLILDPEASVAALEGYARFLPHDQHESASIPPVKPFRTITSSFNTCIHHQKRAVIAELVSWILHRLPTFDVVRANINHARRNLSMKFTRRGIPKEGIMASAATSAARYDEVAGEINVLFGVIGRVSAVAKQLRTGVTFQIAELRWLYLTPIDRRNRIILKSWQGLRVHFFRWNSDERNYQRCESEKCFWHAASPYILPKKQNRRSNRIARKVLENSGATRRDRTGDPLITNEMLYQLS